MRNPARSLLFSLSTLAFLAEVTAVDSSHLVPVSPQPQEIAAIQRASAVFEPFTGKTSRNRVRLRAGADLNSPIVRELEMGTLLGIVGQDDVFYAVKPPKDLKVYVYRTYILDNVVDGSQVNARLEPSLDAPVIAQLNKGDHVEGKISAVNSKWFETSLPESTHLYVAKDFVEKVGPANMFREVHSRREEANRLINGAYLTCQVELQKPAEEMNLESPLTELRNASNTYSDVPEEAARAKNYVGLVEDSLQQRKSGQTEGEGTPARASQESMSRWFPREAELFERWLATNPNKTMDDFYTEEREQALQLRGIVQPYTRSVKNKPGNFILINHQDNQPIAFLYSTQVDLQDKVGQLVSLVALQRPNNNFAFPTFFVMSAE